MIRRNRVVITGIGVLAPNGNGLDEFWTSLLEGRSGIGPITLFDATEFKSRIAGEVKGFVPAEHIEAELRPHRLARHTQLAYAATMMALEDAGLDRDNLELPSPTPVVIGVSTSALDVIERVFHQVNGPGPNRVGPSSLGASKPQAAANVIADRLGACANAATVSSACPSGLDAIAIGAGLIRSGEAEIAVVGGADAPITPLAMASFIASGLSSARNDEPERASRPFDLDRDSGVISEGAGILILEDLERAEARGARIYAEIRDTERSAISTLTSPLRVSNIRCAWPWPMPQRANVISITFLHTGPAIQCWMRLKWALSKWFLVNAPMRSPLIRSRE